MNPMQKERSRLISLDFFRGITVAAMILVNNPGSWSNIYAPLKHAEWNGCTPTDLIFPFFLFIVGVSISYALGSKRLDTASHPGAIKKIIKRSLILFGLGLFLSLYPKVFTDPIGAFENVRIPGVLQRISVVFLVSAIIFLKFSNKSILKILISFLIIYWALMTFVPVPGVGFANLEKETNLGAWLDRTILTEAHLWKSAKTWDPEGILSTLPAISSGLFGILVGVYLKRKDKIEAEKIAWLFTIGFIATALGLIWDLVFPINKSLWTSSFVLYTGGLATICLALCYWIIDVNNYTRFTKPAVVYGVNAITVFFISGLLPRTLNLFKVVNEKGNEVGLANHFYQSVFVPNLEPLHASLAWALMWILFWLGILWIMYNRKIFIKV
ncbi:acyltransferase family protein [Pedobacter flavus]|uniref:Heparan-alpha-glucosaminide N-acetyltransferase domain-containing protein n=1 Tax=Pedobacter flavus TaxID=3113906 RepID=A0ABU7GZZ2_9SPHI|nr:heparan-alpha-glucosaminide N-acetyltransferase domain-containing protein [Pedobacter sp. VNH31]MEE1884604.1 heparan-alpha-glucosaminide N-acetyltransferase domain-containing protein [Pedobacter sp. VNH31]